jgi:hypothetical protein
LLLVALAVELQLNGEAVAVVLVDYLQTQPS